MNITSRQPAANPVYPNSIIDIKELLDTIKEAFQTFNITDRSIYLRAAANTHAQKAINVISEKLKFEGYEIASMDIIYNQDKDLNNGIIIGPYNKKIQIIIGDMF